MKTRLVAILALVLAAPSAPAQERERFYSDPAIPPREALERLNLELAWRVDLPMEGRRDGLVSVQHTGRQILVQTRGGIVALFDAETGRLAWRTRIGDPFLTAFAPAFNSTSVFAINGTNLYALDRSNGTNLWKLSLPGGLAAPPLADEEQVYIFTGTGSVYAYHPTTVEVPENAGPSDSLTGEIDLTADKKPERIVQVVRPLLNWTVVSRLLLDLPAVQTADAVLVPDPSGVLLKLMKFPNDGVGAEADRFALDTSLLASPGVFGSVAYLPGRDGYVYAYDVTRTRILWRQLLGSSAPLTRTPVVTEQDVFAVSEREGMSRLDRETGNPLWRIPRGNRLLNAQVEADRFLAASPKFVYALDRGGRLIILDRARGLMLGRYDVRDFVFPVVNDQTDRLYLAANNGLLLCLRDRDYPRPQEMRKLSEREKQAGKTPEQRAKDLQERLAQLVNFEPGEPQPLSRFLEDIRRVHGVKSFVSEKSFRENNLPLPVDLKVKVPKKDKAPLGDVIQDVLAQINCKFAPLGDEIFIIPTKAGPMPPKP